METLLENTKKRKGPVLFSEYKQGDAIRKVLKNKREFIPDKRRAGVHYPRSQKCVFAG